jgi:hypothetical protein
MFSVQDETARRHADKVHVEKLGYAERRVFRNWGRRVTDLAHPFSERDNVVPRNMEKLGEVFDHLAPGLSLGILDVVDGICIVGLAK